MSLVTRTDVILRANANRVLCRLFIPGEEELIRGASRAGGLIDRCMRLTDEEVVEVLDKTITEFQARHRDLIEQFELHFAAVAAIADPDDTLSLSRRLLIGAYLSQEYAFEAAAYFNPSMVAHPDQTGVEPGAVRYIMSVRVVGEGHISSITFRTGIVDQYGHVTVDPASPHATTYAKRRTLLHRALVEQVARADGLDSNDLQYVLGMLPDPFTPEQLDLSLARLHSTRYQDAGAERVSTRLLELARSSYEVDFADDTDISERVLWPVVANERRGMEDARWTIFTDADGSTRYRATYTAFDGSTVVSRVLETSDFRCFNSMDLTGKAAGNKGVALFPRLVNGQHLALSRWDREDNSIAYSDDGYHWERAVTFGEPVRPWELVHVGNCGSPLETADGWLVITHGTGPMRQYSLGAVLLDLDDPTIVRATLAEPLLVPTEDERNGYVPNVVYSCGGMIHDGLLVLPYGFSDSGTRIATMRVDELIGRMTPARE